jgi:hypothetical protein
MLQFNKQVNGADKIAADFGSTPLLDLQGFGKCHLVQAAILNEPPHRLSDEQPIYLLP